MKIRNPFIKKLLIIIISIILFGIAMFFAYKIINRSYDNLTYDLGEKDNIIYDDIILTSYSEYENFINTYAITKHLSEKHFENAHYLATFQDYDSCSEEKAKSVNKIEDINGTLNVEFIVYNKCGFCKNHTMLHLIKLDSFYNESKFKYNYTYNSNKECGEV